MIGAKNLVYVLGAEPSFVIERFIARLLLSWLCVFMWLLKRLLGALGFILEGVLFWQSIRVYQGQVLTYDQFSEKWVICWEPFLEG